jgi:hypothetical protein
MQIERVAQPASSKDLAPSSFFVDHKVEVSEASDLPSDFAPSEPHTTQTPAIGGS